jgi:AraC-like DNA-binding protein
MTAVPPARHLLRARDFADRHYAEQIGVDEMAAAAGLSRAHFSREFSRTFGESPKAYLMTRRLERAAALLRNTDHSVSEICLDVGLVGLGSFTTSFKQHFAMTPTEYRASFPPAAAQVIVPACYLRQYGRPQHSTKREDSGRGGAIASPTAQS